MSRRKVGTNQIRGFNGLLQAEGGLLHHQGFGVEGFDPSDAPCALVGGADVACGSVFAGALPAGDDPAAGLAGVEAGVAGLPAAPAAEGFAGAGLPAGVELELGRWGFPWLICNSFP